MSKVEEKSVVGTLVSKIMSILKLDDAGKLEKFFAGEVKAIKNGINAIELNKKTAALQHEMALSEIDSKIEDAEEAVKDAYTAVTVEQINSNDAMKSFSSDYWANIDSKESKLERLKKDREAQVKSYDEQLEARNEKIAKQNARIAAIS